MARKRIKSDKFKQIILEEVSALEKQAEKPPQFCAIIPTAKLLNYGWAWAVYETSDTVIKIPRGVFPQINDPSTLLDTLHIYRECQEFLQEHTFATEFSRFYETNIIVQPKINGLNKWTIFDIATLSEECKQSLRHLVYGLLDMLMIHHWMPDLQLKQIRDGVWQAWDVALVEDKVYLFDFTSIYDPYRISPEQTLRMIGKDRIQLERLLKELR